MVLAFALYLSVYLLIGKTSALIMNVAGVLKDWILIIISSLMFGAPVSKLQLLGYLLAFSAVCYYNYQKYLDRVPIKLTTRDEHGVKRDETEGSVIEMAQRNVASDSEGLPVTRTDVLRQHSIHTHTAR